MLSGGYVSRILGNQIKYALQDLAMAAEQFQHAHGI